MEKEYLHLEGPVLSRIVAGAWRWDSTVKVDTLINTCLDAGITSFDHADIYGDYENQKIFGDVLKKNPSLRKNMQLVSKCGIMLVSSKHPGTWVKHYDTSKAHILKSVDDSLAALGTDYLDLLLIHRPDPFMDPEEVSEAFGLLRQNGKVLHFGVSNFTHTQFEMLRKYLPFPLVTNQIELSLSRLDPLFDGTLDVLQKYEACPMVYSPLGKGKLVLENTESKLWSEKEKYKATETQLALAWLLSHPARMFPVIGTTKANRIVESAKAVDIRLDRQDWFEMLRIASGEDVP
ncbi:MAG TPA: aldo/keto reductase [Chryseosolibacter sp.]|nr:aldo/keto reductase [Chryseosolibacter sp.]